MLKVVSVNEDGAASVTDIAENDFLIKLNDDLVETNSELTAAIAKIKESGQLDIRITYSKGIEIKEAQISLTSKLGLSTKDVFIDKAPSSVRALVNKLQNATTTTPPYSKIVILTTDNFPNSNYKILGLCRGSTVRGKNAISDAGAALKNIVGGELKSYTQLMADTREQAISRMQEDAFIMGANAIIGMRLVSSTIDVGTAEICAYGTAILLDDK